MVEKKAFSLLLSHSSENGIPPQSILLLTFTNKAANEMSERAAQILDERCNKITACTYHSFCAKMLRIYGVLVGLRKNFTILSESDVVNTIKLLIAENPEKYKIKSGFSVSEIAKIFSMSINHADFIIRNFYDNVTISIAGFNI